MLETFRFAMRGLKQWTSRQFQVAFIVAILVGLLIGVATVLIPNPWFARDIEPVWWNYPVWLLTALATGMLVATYIRPVQSQPEAQDTEASYNAQDRHPGGKDRHSRMGVVGGILSWFAVGCPVCNKLALIAFGYSGAITYFAPIQPFLALAALLLTFGALMWRLKGQVVCKVPVPATIA